MTSRSIRNLHCVIALVLAVYWGAWLVPFGICQTRSGQDQDTDRSKQIAIEQIADGTFQIKNGDELFAEFYQIEYGKPIIYPLLAADGTQITRNYPMKKDIPGEAIDHPHHKSVWVGHGDVNGKDFWADKEQIVCKSVAVDGAELSIVNHWIVDDTPLVIERTRFRFSQRGAVRLIDVHISLYPGENIPEVTFGDTKEGFFALRARDEFCFHHRSSESAESVSKGRAINSNSETDREIWGKMATWVHYMGTVGAQQYGITVIDHCNNLRHPTTWHARDYGLIAANPFGLHEFQKQPKGAGSVTLRSSGSSGSSESLELQYRVLISVGALEVDEINSFSSDFHQSK
ncbi:MAG TPA: PmoA family protein [Pirellulaceae bacterium]|nr:PmoA family protein [Pirellulaceae bacterium]HMO93200.1 PmoA family protein [Pirellulaceae bacterium]HMP70031.1 PmoA family protein [Pirellulaceae bacterium]